MTLENSLKTKVGNRFPVNCVGEKKRKGPDIYTWVEGRIEERSLAYLWIFRIKATEANYCKNTQRKHYILYMWVIYVCVCIYLHTHIHIYDLYQASMWHNILRFPDIWKGYLLYSGQWQAELHGSAPESWTRRPFGVDWERKTNSHRSPASLYPWLSLKAKYCYSISTEFLPWF